jgi:hypothetical protein
MLVTFAYEYTLVFLERQLLAYQLPKVYRSTLSPVLTFPFRVDAAAMSIFIWPLR